MLSWFGFQFTGDAEVGDQRQVDADTMSFKFPAELTNCFNVWQGLDISNCASNFCDHNVIIAALTKQLHSMLDFIGDMGNHLNGLTKEITTTLLVDDRLVHATSGDIVCLRCGLIEKTFVMT